MTYIIIVLKFIVSISLINVWLIQKDAPTKWRGGNAQNLKQEFEVYGLPAWMLYVVGVLKVVLALCLLASIWFTLLAQPAALALAVLLLGSIIMHFKINDPLYKSMPAAIFLVLCLIIAFSDQIIA
ncbi:DoxX family protein [Sediminibacter sp. Hel_I_10]|uniref:DoxX family protein n=1 Tax=Sediminibacter sp. Hel_I_10 TaxID=1392490 RepID=UPI00047ABBE3|nr:DoxX family protein [Sediminibacter sp. Hel_I_10]